MCVCVCVCVCTPTSISNFSTSRSIVAKLLMNVVLLENTLNTTLLNRLRPVITSVWGEYMGRDGHWRQLHMDYTWKIIGSKVADVARTETLRLRPTNFNVFVNGGGGGRRRLRRHSSNSSTVISRLTKIIRSGITFVSRNFSRSRT